MPSTIAVPALALALALAGAAAEVTAPAGEVPPDRVLVFSAEAPAYRALAIRPSIRTNAEAPTRLVVFRDGLCVLDRGLLDARREGGSAPDGRLVVEQSGTTERAVAADDLSAAVLVTTRYISRVDVTPGETSTKDDLVRAESVLTLVDPAQPHGRWQLTLEEGRWVRDLLALPGGAGAVLTSFVPRNGPTDFRILGPSGHQSARVPDTRAETIAFVVAPEGRVVAADVKFKDSRSSAERGIVVFDLASGTEWTYGWRYGSDDEPLGWSLEADGTLVVRLGRQIRRFDRSGRRL